MSVLFLVLSSLGLWLAWNAARPPARRGIGPLWLPALFTGELALFQAAGQAGMAAGFSAAGWAGGWAGGTGLVATGAAVLGLVWIQVRALGTRRVVEGAAADVLGGPLRLPPVRLGRLVRPYPSPPADVEVVRNLAYGPDASHLGDRFRRRGHQGRGPVLVQIHGGGWTGGRRDQQARPLVHRMALAGWVVFAVTYRLSPRATFPDQLVDVKRAIAWIREHADHHGADADFIALTGGSAGGQLAALAALTTNDPTYQPGFEGANTSVQAVVPLYGVHDLLDGTGTRPKWPYLASHVLKVGVTEDPDAWRRASPIRMADHARPPFLIVHGSNDSLVRAGDSRRLAEALRGRGGPPVGYAEVPGATHGFDSLHSLRAERVVDAIEVVMSGLWSRRELRPSSGQ